MGGAERAHCLQRRGGARAADAQADDGVGEAVRPVPVAQPREDRAHADVLLGPDELEPAAEKRKVAVVTWRDCSREEETR